MRKNRLKFMQFDHHRNDVAPFTACVLAGCNWEIKGNGDYKFEVPRFSMTPKQTIDWVSDTRNYFNEGIVISYMDRNNRAEEIVDLITDARVKGLSIMIETDREIEDFEEYIGKAMAKKNGYPKEEDAGFYKFVGMSILDFIIGEEYYIIAGHKRNMYVIDPEDGR